MPPIAFDIFAALLGLVFGSFLNVCITRLPRRESIVLPASHCRHCGSPIAWYHNLPIVSWLMLGGRCRNCRKPIGLRYLIVEADLSILWLLVAIHFGASLESLKTAALCFFLVGCIVTDAETFLLPHALTLPGIAIGFAFAVVASLFGPDRATQWKPALEGALLGAVVLLAIDGVYWLFRRRHGIGMGDALLLAMVGAFLGPAQVLLVFFLGTIAAAAATPIFILLRRKGSDWKSLPLPYGCFLGTAAIACVFFGQAILGWYLSLFR